MVKMYNKKGEKLKNKMKIVTSIKNTLAKDNRDFMRKYHPKRTTLPRSVNYKQVSQISGDETKERW